MPWTKEKDTYKIWISEIILQQTRVGQGIEYYNNFIGKFPTLQSLAEADEETIFKMWEGLGYYTRAKNLYKTAKEVYYNLDGRFPATYDQLLTLSGIGPYTAAAISSFAYGLPHAVVDGNVFRIISRFFGEFRAIDSIAGKKYFTSVANKLLFKDDPASYNQAIMDFGATVCKPQVPACQQCILQKDCTAFHEGIVNKLPVKEKVLIKKKRWFTYFIFMVGDKVLVNKRTGKDIWQNLYEFYLYESEKIPKWSRKEINKWLHEQMGIESYELQQISLGHKQQLTHQTLEGSFITVLLPRIAASLQHFKAVNADEMKSLAFPNFINQYLKN